MLFLHPPLACDVHLGMRAGASVQQRRQPDARKPPKPLPHRVMNSFMLAGMPPHELRVKKNAPIMLLRNSNAAAGIANSMGQNLSRANINLPNPAFTHGQLHMPSRASGHGTACMCACSLRLHTTLATSWLTKVHKALSPKHCVSGRHSQLI